VTFDEAVECFFADFQIRRNKKYRDRYQLLGGALGGRKLKIIFQLKTSNVAHHYGVANMKKRRTTRPSEMKTAQDQVDRFVTAQADENSAWQKAIVVRRPKSRSLSIPAELAARAAFLAGLHRESRVDKWVERIVRERVEIEESAFTAAKKTLVS